MYTSDFKKIKIYVEDGLIFVKLHTHTYIYLERWFEISENVNKSSITPYSTTTTKNPKWTKDLNGHFSKEEYKWSLSTQHH